MSKLHWIWIADALFIVFSEKIQWIQCEDCFKWRKVPDDAVLPSRWTCSENSRDPERYVGISLTYLQDALKMSIEYMKDAEVDCSSSNNQLVRRRKGSVLVNYSSWNELQILDNESHRKNCPLGINLSFIVLKADRTSHSMVGFSSLLLAVCPFNQLCSILLSPIFCSFQKVDFKLPSSWALGTCARVSQLKCPALHEFLSLEKKKNFLSFHFIWFSFSVSEIWLFMLKRNYQLMSVHFQNSFVNS